MVPDLSYQNVGVKEVPQGVGPEFKLAQSTCTHSRGFEETTVSVTYAVNRVKMTQ